MKTLIGVLAIAIGIIVIILVARNIGLSSHTTHTLPTTTISINNQKVTLEEAKTPLEQQTGLSERTTLGDYEGMIFPFNQAGYYAFWMKNMHFPIDIIFLYKNRVVSIFQNVPNPTFPTDNLPIYKPELPADTVVELKASQSAKLNIKKGDILNISL